MHQGVVVPQSGRTVQAAGRPVTLALAALLAGCLSTPPVKLDVWGDAQNCHFAHVSKQEFEIALRRVFDASRPRIYGLRPEEGGALVEQHWALDAVFASASGSERWELEYAPAGDGIDARAEVEHTRAGLSPAGDKAPPPAVDYQLLWARIAYVLGNRADWPRCASPPKVLRVGLCSTAASDSPPIRIARLR